MEKKSDVYENSLAFDVLAVSSQSVSRLVGYFILF